MDDLSKKPFAFQQRVAACRKLYNEFHGCHHDDIQAEMRALGHERWNSRCLYARRSAGGKRIPGWPERFRFRSEPPGSAGGSENGELRTESGKLEENGTLGKRGSLNSQLSFRSWLKRISPGMTWSWKYQSHIIKKLKLIYEGKLKRLMIFVPPRHGKSELVTVRFSAWCLRNRPKMNIIIGSYNQKLANRFSRKIRHIHAHAAALEMRSAECGMRNEDTSIHNKKTCDKCIAHAQKCPHETKDGERNENGEVRIENGELKQGSSHSPLSVLNSQFRPKQTDAEWETTDGGGVRAVGVGAGITGFGADLIIIDDPVKSRAEAESKTMRDNLSDWFNDDLYTRLEPDGAIILIQTRWHEDDLAGRLLREMHEDPDAEKWEVIEFPAIAEPARSGELRTENGKLEEEILHSPLSILNSQFSKPALFYTVRGQRIPIRTIGVSRNKDEDQRTENGEEKTENEKLMQSPSSNSQFSTLNSQFASWRDILGRRPGEPLCPARFPLKKLEQTRRRLGTYSFSALYQQRPTPAEGGFFKRHWFKIVDFAPPHLRWTRGYDLGISANPGADYTATARVGRDRDGNIYIDRVFRKRMEYPEQRRAILGLILKEWDTEHLIEESANGNAVIQDLRRERRILNRKFRGVKVRESKTARAFTWNALAEEGRVHLVRGAWNSEFIDEACAFPTGAHDDQIDAVSIAVRSIMNVREKFYAF